MDIRIVTVPVPASLDDPDASLLRQVAAIGRANARDVYGYEDLAYSDQELLAMHQDATDTATITYAALIDDDVVGNVRMSVPLQDNRHVIDFLLLVHPDHRRRGVGSALLDRLLDYARENGRTALFVGTPCAVEPAEDDPDVILPPTGSGRVSSTSAAARFAFSHGFTLEQAERHSVLHLPADPAALDRLFREAAERADADYRLVQWEGPTPAEWLDDIARLQAGMSTDVPMGGLEYDPEEWTAERVQRTDELTVAQGRIMLTTAAQHRATGHLVGFTEFACPVGTDFVFQNNTLVLSDHRGHRLGQWIKVANLAVLTERLPEVRRIHTWNAEENQYMLGINVAMGFAPEGADPVWQLRL